MLKTQRCSNCHNAAAKGLLACRLGYGSWANKRLVSGTARLIGISYGILLLPCILDTYQDSTEMDPEKPDQIVTIGLRAEHTLEKTAGRRQA